MGVMTGEDPLTCDLEEILTYNTWPRTREGTCLLCDVPEFAEHKNSCSWSPIYAKLVPPEMNMMIGSFHAVNVMVKQTVIKCAECGMERLAKDLAVVYKSWVTDPQPYHTHNIVKAVCPEHV